VLGLVLILVSWGVCIGAWLAVSFLGPKIADNRPRRDLAQWEVDSQV
jgi:hypothetical protein